MHKECGHGLLPGLLCPWLPLLFPPEDSTTPMRRFLSVLGLANRRTSTGASGSPRASASATPSNPKSLALAVGEDDRRRRGAGQFDRRDRQAEDGAQVKLELVRDLADQRHHAGIMRARAQLGEDRPVAGDEEFDAENAMAAQRRDDLAPPGPGRSKHRLVHRRRLPAFAIIARFLAVADRRAEQHAVLGRDGQQGDLDSRRR